MPASAWAADLDTSDSRESGWISSELPEVVVLGSRVEVRLDDAPVDTLLITRREIEDTGARDLADLLESQPGVEIIRDGSFGAGLRLQGLQGQHVLVLIDGQRMNGRTRGNVDLSRISTDRIASVEVVRGASSSLYGSEAMGGVINITTRRGGGKPLEASAQLRGDSANGYEVRGSSAIASESSSLRVGAGLLRSEPFQLDDALPSTSGSARSDWDLDVRGDHAFNSTLRIVGNVGWMSAERAGVDLGAGGAIFDRRDRTESLSLRLAPGITLGDEHSLEFAFHFTDLKNQLLQDQRGSRAMDQLQIQGEQLWEASAVHAVRLGDHHITSGVEILYEHLESPRLNSGEGERFRPAVFVQDDWQLSDEPLVALTPGLRFDHDSDFGGQFSPKLSGRWEPVEELLVRASYGWGFRAASFQELLMHFENPSVGYVVEGNPELRPESSRGASAGLTYRPTRWLRADLGVFRNDLQNLITSATTQAPAPGAPQIFQYTNVDEARTQGVESGVRLRPWAGWIFDLGYTFTDAKNLSADQWLEGRPRHRATFGTTWRAEAAGFTANVRGEWVGERPFYGVSSGLGEGALRWADPYTLASARIAQELGANVSVFVGAENIFDAGNPDDLALTPRSFFAGVHTSY